MLLVELENRAIMFERAVGRVFSRLTRTRLLELRVHYLSGGWWEAYVREGLTRAELVAISDLSVWRSRGSRWERLSCDVLDNSILYLPTYICHYQRSTLKQIFSSTSNRNKCMIDNENVTF